MSLSIFTQTPQKQFKIASYQQNEDVFCVHPVAAEIIFHDYIQYKRMHKSYKCIVCLNIQCNNIYELIVNIIIQSHLFTKPKSPTLSLSVLAFLSEIVKYENYM